MDVHTALVIMHIIGTALGVGGATFIEALLIKSLRDGVVDASEGALMQTTYNIVRVGFLLLMLSGFGFLILYRLEGNVAMLYDIKIWTKHTIVAIIAINAALLQLRWIPLRWGSAISIVSWYAALVIGTLRPGEYSLLWICGLYVAAIFAAYFIIREMHRRFLPHPTT